MQRIEIGNAVSASAAALGVHHGAANGQSCRILDNPRIAVRPIVSVAGEKAHPIVANMNLEPVAVMLDFMNPAGAGRRPLGNAWAGKGI